MIEREFIKTKIKNLRIRQRINDVVTKSAGCGNITIEKTPMGEKIIVDTVRPGIVIGRGGETIKKLTSELKSYFGLENPQIEVREILKPSLVAATVAKKISDDMERFGPRRFKALGYRALGNILKEGAMGAEIKISGRGIPSQRSKTWRFYGGYLKKCGDIAVSKIDVAIERANLRSGAVGIIVSIMLPDTYIPDRIKIIEPVVKIEEVKETPKELKNVVAEDKPVEEKKAAKLESPSKSKEEEIKKVPAKKEETKKEETKKPAAKKEVKKPAKKPATKKKEDKLSQMKPSTAVDEADKKPMRKEKETKK
ncbi:30S ribosomal protein S3 [Candidatus Woesearchaeota archaeon]|jgi:small subunit ribosomal protein S3|nr:30S ribosomal protein S3 [Candidatus Woesearchaeota archaeon]MBT7062977.1 30S ribosomal protein S3 [Candidatus Woesearchaeota archaeon]MBT7402794.1 30S ribosomal protein S3 [Candidatus Woesearchaeota archaeon]